MSSTRSMACPQVQPGLFVQALTDLTRRPGFELTIERPGDLIGDSNLLG
jgi:hypothetical protein